MCLCVPGVAEAAETKPDVGWGRVRVFLQRLGKRADSRSLGLAHCDLTATDLLELGANTHAHGHTLTHGHTHTYTDTRLVDLSFMTHCLALSIHFLDTPYNL